MISDCVCAQIPIKQGPLSISRNTVNDVYRLREDHCSRTHEKTNFQACAGSASKKKDRLSLASLSTWQLMIGAMAPPKLTGSVLTTYYRNSFRCTSAYIHCNPSNRSLRPFLLHDPCSDTNPLAWRVPIVVGSTVSDLFLQPFFVQVLHLLLPVW